MTIKEAMKDWTTANNARSKAHKAHKEAEKALLEYMDEFKARKEQEDAHEAELIDALSRAEKNLKLARAVSLACSENVATVAANTFINYVNQNRELFADVPTRFKKFEKLFSDCVGDGFYFDSSYYSFYVYFSHGEHGHNSRYAFSTDGGYLDFSEDENKNKGRECTLSEIRKEAKQAFKDSERLRKAVDALKAKDARKEYNTPIRYLMPYLEVSPIHDEYRLF